MAPGGYNNSSGIVAWSAATHVTDGTVTWVCLASIDYNTFTGANIDDFVNWAPSTDYFKLQFALTTNGNVYYASGVSSGFVGNSLTCTTGSTEPTSTTAGNPGTTDGGCAWLYVGNVGYSSKAKILPHELASYFWPGGFTQAMVPQYNYHDTLRLWWGGHAKKLYQNGVAGEATQIAVQLRYNQPSDNGFIITMPGGSGISNVTRLDLTQEIAAASGDGFADNMNPASDPLRFDPTKGTSIFTNLTYTPDVADNPGTTGYGLCLSDFAQWVYRLQFQSTLGAGLFAGGFCTDGYNDNGDWFHHNIIDSGGGPSGSGFITGSAFSNNLIIFRGSGTYAAPGPPPLAAGSYEHYGNASFDNTIIGPGAGACANCMAVQADRFSQYGPTLPIGSNSLLFNNLTFGWGQEWGTYQGGQSDYGNCPGATCYAGNNGTDLPSIICWDFVYDTAWICFRNNDHRDSAFPRRRFDKLWRGQQPELHEPCCQRRVRPSQHRRGLFDLGGLAAVHDRFVRSHLASNRSWHKLCGPERVWDIGPRERHPRATAAPDRVCQASTSAQCRPR